MSEKREGLSFSKWKLTQLHEFSVQSFFFCRFMSSDHDDHDLSWLLSHIGCNLAFLFEDDFVLRQPFSSWTLVSLCFERCNDCRGERAIQWLTNQHLKGMSYPRRPSFRRQQQYSVMQLSWGNHIQEMCIIRAHDVSHDSRLIIEWSWASHHNRCCDRIKPVIRMKTNRIFLNQKNQVRQHKGDAVIVALLFVWSIIHSFPHFDCVLERIRNSWFLDCCCQRKEDRYFNWVVVFLTSSLLFIVRCKTFLVRMTLWY
jgi:hypothetical protein